MQFGVAEPGEDAACAVETHAPESVFPHALLAPAVDALWARYIAVEHASFKPAAAFATKV